jgi:hypothetical protein
MVDNRAERDPSDELLKWAAEQGLITEDQAEDSDGWAGELATQLMREDITQEQLDEMIAERVARDVAKRGQA